MSPAGCAPLLRTGSLVGRPVVIRDVRLGVAVDALFDRALGRLVGLDVRCDDEAHRFLPYPACEVLEDRLAVESALVLLDRELDFYRVGGSTLSDLRGQAVLVAGDELGTLADLLVDPEGEVVGDRRRRAARRDRDRARRGRGRREPRSPPRGLTNLFPWQKEPR